MSMAMSKATGVSRPYGPEYWDEYGVLKLSVGFYLLMILLTNSYWLWIMTAATMRPDLDLLSIFYPVKEQFLAAIAMQLPAMLFLMQ